MIFRLSAWMATYLLSFGAGGRLKKTIGMLAALAVRIAGIAALLSVGMKMIPSTLRSTIAFNWSFCLFWSRLEIVSSVVQPFSFALAFRMALPVIQKSESKASNMRAMVLPPSAARATRGETPTAVAARAAAENSRLFNLIVMLLLPGMRAHYQTRCCTACAVDGNASHHVSSSGERQVLAFLPRGRLLEAPSSGGP